MLGLGLVGLAVPAPRARADFSAELGPARSAVAMLPPAAVEPDSWTLDPRVYAWPGQFTGCPEGERNAVENECLAAVVEVAAKLGTPLAVHYLKVVDAGDDGWVPSGCSYSRGHGLQAMFNRNPAGRNTESYPLVCSKRAEKAAAAKSAAAEKAAEEKVAEEERRLTAAAAAEKAAAEKLGIPYT